MNATARPSPSAITQALVPPDQVRGRLRRPASAPALHAGPAQLETPFSGGPGRFLMRPDAGAVEKRHPELNVALLDQGQKLLPDAQPRPADEGLSGTGPGTQFSRDGAPLRSVLMPPEDGRDRATEILGRGLALETARLDQRLQRRPLRVR